MVGRPRLGHEALTLAPKGGGRLTPGNAVERPFASLGALKRGDRLASSARSGRFHLGPSFGLIYSKKRAKVKKQEKSFR
jgi:hypothetical protein